MRMFLIARGSSDFEASVSRSHTPEDYRMLHHIKNFLKSEDGPTAVEYAVMLALIVIVCLTAIRAVGTNANSRFNAVKNSLT